MYQLIDALISPFSRFCICFSYSVDLDCRTFLRISPFLHSRSVILYVICLLLLKSCGGICLLFVDILPRFAIDLYFP